MLFSKKKNHLQLVSNLSSVSDDSQINYFLKNNIFPENSNEGEFFLFVRESDIIRGSEFSDTLRKIRPEYLFDIRITPRLDFLAPNRAMAFKIFDKMDINYTDVFGVMGVDSYDSEGAIPEEWGLFVASFLFNKVVSGRVSLFIFDNDSILARARHVLPAILKSLWGSREMRIELLNSHGESLIAM